MTWKKLPKYLDPIYSLFLTLINIYLSLDGVLAGRVKELFTNVDGIRNITHKHPLTGGFGNIVSIDEVETDILLCQFCNLYDRASEERENNNIRLKSASGSSLLGTTEPTLNNWSIAKVWMQRTEPSRVRIDEKKQLSNYLGL